MKAILMCTERGAYDALPTFLGQEIRRELYGLGISAALWPCV
jgi:hypothetical protein